MFGIGYLVKLAEILRDEALKEQQKLARQQLIAEIAQLERDGKVPPRPNGPIVKRIKPGDTRPELKDPDNDARTKQADDTTQQPGAPPRSPLTLREALRELSVALRGLIEAYAESERRRHAPAD